MIKTIQLNEHSRKGLEKINTWLGTFPKSKEVYFLGQMKYISTLQETIVKVLIKKEYTDYERNILNDLRQRYLDKNIEEDLPF